MLADTTRGLYPADPFSRVRKVGKISRHMISICQRADSFCNPFAPTEMAAFSCRLQEYRRVSLRYSAACIQSVSRSVKLHCVKIGSRH